MNGREQLTSSRDLEQSQRAVASSLRDAFSEFSLKGMVSQGVSANVFETLSGYHNAFCAHEGQIGSLWYESVAKRNRFRVFAGNQPGDIQTQVLREDTFDAFEQLFDEFDETPRSQVISWSMGSRKRSLSLGSKARAVLRGRRGMGERHRSLARFYLTLAYGECGFGSEDNVNFERYAIAETLFMRGRDHYFDYIDSWWDGERDRRERSGKYTPDEITDALYRDREPMYQAIRTAHIASLEGWKRLLAMGVCSPMERGAVSVAIRDIEAIHQEESQMGYRYGNPQDYNWASI